MKVQKMVGRNKVDRETCTVQNYYLHRLVHKDNRGNMDNNDMD